jgi:hypothetical protein
MVRFVVRGDEPSGRQEVVARKIVVCRNVGACGRGVGGRGVTDPVGEILPPALLRRGVRRVVPRRAPPVAFLPALGLNTGRNGGGVEVRKGPQRPAARVPGC